MPDPRRNLNALLELVEFLRENPRGRTIVEICERFGLKQRAAYRWIKYLEDMNEEVFIRRKEKNVFYLTMGDK
jgi:predicted DNA-binding transcriptional regulator YafY